MEKMICITDSAVQPGTRLPKVYLCCHPTYRRFCVAKLAPICGAVWLAADPNVCGDEEFKAQLAQMDQIVVVVTDNLVSDPYRALEDELDAAVYGGVPLVPLQKCGQCNAAFIFDWRNEDFPHRFARDDEVLLKLGEMRRQAEADAVVEGVNDSEKTAALCFGLADDAFYHSKKLRLEAKARWKRRARILCEKMRQEPDVPSRRMALAKAYERVSFDCSCGHDEAVAVQWLCRELEVLSGPEKEVGSVLDYITELDGIPLITEPRAEMAQRATVAAMQAGLPEARIGMGCLFYLMEEYTEAKSWLKSALRCQKDPEENAERTAALHLYLGLSCCGEWYDDDGKAIEFLQISYDRYTALAQSDSGSEWLLPRIICANRLGALYLKKKNMEQAEQWGEIMVELSKQLDKPVGTEYTGLQLFGACYWMGRLCFQLKRNDEAVRWMQRSCKYGIRAAQKTGARKLLLLMDKALHDPAVLRSRWDCLEAGQTRSYYVGIVRRKLQELGVTP